MSNKNSLRIPIVNSNQSSNQTTFKVSLNKEIVNKPFNFTKVENININFNVNDRVFHKEEKLIGTVKFIGDEKLSIVWDDGTRERFSKSDLKDLELYIDNTETKTNSISDNTDSIETRQIPTKNSEPKVKDELEDLFQKAFMEMDDEYDDIIDANPENLKKKMVGIKTDKLEKTLENNTINNIKEKAVNELIVLMKNKQLIKNSEDENIQRNKILKMNDSEFENFKNSVINNKTVKEVEMTEAEKMLERIKHGGAIIGGFDEPGSNSFNLNNTFDNIGSPDNSRSLTSIASKEQKIVQHQHLNLDGFRDLQGLTKPIQVVAEQKNPRQNIADMVAELDWTTISKLY